MGLGCLKGPERPSFSRKFTETESEADAGAEIEGRDKMFFGKKELPQSPTLLFIH
jgi:hypothetical protein